MTTSSETNIKEFIITEETTQEELVDILFEVIGAKKTPPEWEGFSIEPIETTESVKKDHEP